MANAIFKYPLRFTSSSYVLRVTANSVTENLTFAVTIGTDYYMGDATGELLDMLEDCLDSHSEISGSTVTYSQTDRRVKITTTENVSILWTDGSTTLDKSIFGFTATASPNNSTVTATNMPRGIWDPRRAVSKDTRERQPLVSSIARAISGAQRTAVLAVPLKERDFSLEWIAKEYALEEYAQATEPYNTLERAWLDGIGYGRVFKVDSDSYRIREVTDPLVKRENIHYWDANFKVVEA